MPTMKYATVKSRRKMCSNTLFDVYFDHVILNNGQSRSRYLVIEPRPQRSDRVAGVAILPVTARGIGLINVYRHALKTRLWEIPRGFVEKGESVRRAALRELEEEMGIRCPTRNLVELGHIAPEPGIVAARIALFAAFVPSSSLQTHCGDEFGHTQIRYFSDKELSKATRTYSLQDPCTLVALYRYNARFGMGEKKLG